VQEEQATERLSCEDFCCRKKGAQAAPFAALSCVALKSKVASHASRPIALHSASGELSPAIGQETGANQPAAASFEKREDEI
jgi:hypothetical protein